MAKLSSGGRMATTYMDKFLADEFDKAIAASGMLHSHYVRLAIVEKLAADGHISSTHLAYEKERVARLVAKPHGNSKQAKLDQAKREGEEAYVRQQERQAAEKESQEDALRRIAGQEFEIEPSPAQVTRRRARAARAARRQRIIGGAV